MRQWSRGAAGANVNTPIAERVEQGRWKVLNQVLDRIAEHQEDEDGHRRGRTRERLWRLKPTQEYVCECHARIFKDQRSLSIHLGVLSKRGNYTCECHGTVFKSKQGLTLHLRPKRGKAICELCGRVVTTGPGMTQHVNAHRLAALGLKYPCPNCDFAAKTKMGLQMHMGNEAMAGKEGN